MLFLQKPCPKETREGHRPSRVVYILCHCEERSDVAIPHKLSCHCEERSDVAISPKFPCHCEERKRRGNLLVRSTEMQCTLGPRF